MYHKRGTVYIGVVLLVLFAAGVAHAASEYIIDLWGESPEALEIYEISISNSGVLDVVLMIGDGPKSVVLDSADWISVIDGEAFWAGCPCESGPTHCSKFMDDMNCGCHCESGICGSEVVDIPPADKTIPDQPDQPDRPDEPGNPVQGCVWINHVSQGNGGGQWPKCMPRSAENGHGIGLMPCDCSLRGAAHDDGQQPVIPVDDHGPDNVPEEPDTGPDHAMGQDRAEEVHIRNENRKQQ